MSVPAWSDNDVRAALEGVYRHVIDHVDAGRALRRTLSEKVDPPRQPVHVLAVGKAAPAMADAAGEWLRQSGLDPILPTGVWVLPGTVWCATDTRDAT